MSNFKDKEPELPSYLNKDFDDSTKRIEVIKESTQKVEVVKEELKKTDITNGETQVINTIKDEMLNSLSKDVVENKEISNDLNAKIEDTEKTTENVEIKKKNKKEKKPPTMKKIILKRIIFVILFAVVAIGLTLYLASKNNPEVKEKIEEITNTIIKPQEEPKQEVEEKIVNPEGTYSLNPIKINRYEMDVLGKKVEYVQIDGLKDDSVEIKINNKIREKTNKVATELFTKYQITNYYSGCTVRGNFANILSISAYVQVGINDWEEYHEEEFCFNFNLIDGNEFSIDDVFSSKFNMENVLLDELYESVVEEHAEFDDYDGAMVVPNDAEDIEEIVYSIISDYQRGKEIAFYVTPQKVSVKTGAWSEASILFNDYIEYITIYDKFKTTENIYDGNYNAKSELPNLTNLEEWGSLEEYISKEGSNYYINAAWFTLDNDECPETVTNAVRTIFNNYIHEKEVIDSANRIEGMFRIYNIKFDLNYWDGVYYLRIEDLSYDTTKSKYTSVLKEEIKNFFRRDFSGYAYSAGNVFLSDLNYYEPIIVNGEQDYKYHEFIDYEKMTYDYGSAEFDSIGNMFRIDGDDTVLEIID